MNNKGNHVKPKRASFILATCNRSAYLEKAIANAREFVTDEDELIVIDCQSHDGTAQILAKNADIISLVISEPDYCEAHGFNKGLLVAKGEFIKFLTDDDYFFPKGIERALDVLCENPDIDALLCGGEHCFLNPINNRVETRLYFRLSEKKAMELNQSLSQGGTVYGCGLGLIFRRRILPFVGILDTSFRCCDTEFLARLRRPQINFRYFDDMLYRHVDYPHSSVMVAEDAARDAARVLITYGAWASAMRCPEGALTAALKLDGISGGKDILKLLRFFEQVRRNDSSRGLLRLFGAWAELLMKSLKYTRKMSVSLYSCDQQKRGCVTGSNLVEPLWEKALF